MVVEIQCKKCKKNKPIYKFFKANTCLDGYNEYCNDCIIKAIENFI
jgi:hypothetical protein